MDDVSSKPGPFICPPGFAEVPPDEELPVLHDEEEELCLIRTPWEFDMGLLKDKKIPLSGSAVIQDSEEKCFECKSFDATETEITHMKALFPRRSGGLVPFSFGWHLTIAETIVIPDIEELATSTEQKVKHLDMPQGLCQRFLPFGSDEPVVTHVGSKKKKKGHRTSQQIESLPEDSPDSSVGHHRKSSKHKQQEVPQNFSLEESYKKSKRRSKEFLVEGHSGASESVRIKEEPQSDPEHQDTANIWKAHKKNTTAVSEDIQSARKSKKRKHDRLSDEHNQSVLDENEETLSRLKRQKMRESFIANNYYVASEEEDQHSQVSDESWNSLNRTQSVRTGEGISTPKKKRKTRSEEQLRIKEEIMSPVEEGDIPLLDSSSSKKKKKKRENLIDEQHRSVLFGNNESDSTSRSKRQKMSDSFVAENVVYRHGNVNDESWNSSNKMESSRTSEEVGMVKKKKANKEELKKAEMSIVRTPHNVRDVPSSDSSSSKKKKKRDSLIGDHNRSVLNANKGSESRSKKHKVRESMVDESEVDQHSHVNSWNSLNCTQSSRTGAGVETPKKKSKREERFRIKEEEFSPVVTPHKEYDDPPLSSSSIKKKKKKKRSRSEVRVKIEYPELNDSDSN